MLKVILEDSFAMIVCIDNLVNLSNITGNCQFLDAMPLQIFNGFYFAKYVFFY